MKKIAFYDIRVSKNKPKAVVTIDDNEKVTDIKGDKNFIIATFPDETYSEEKQGRVKKTEGKSWIQAIINNLERSSYIQITFLKENQNETH